MTNLKWCGDEEGLRELISSSKLRFVNPWIAISNKSIESTPKEFLDKARFYINQKPADVVRCGEQVWCSVVHLVMRLYLEAGGIDIQSHTTLAFLSDFTIYKCAQLTFGSKFELYQIFQEAKKLYERPDDFSIWECRRVIGEMEDFMAEFEKIDRKVVWNKFEKAFLMEKCGELTVQKCGDKTMKLGGQSFKINYTVFYK